MTIVRDSPFSARSDGPGFVCVILVINVTGIIGPVNGDRFFCSDQGTVCVMDDRIT